MLKRLEYWILIVAGAVCLALVIANMVLFSSNRTLQSEVNARAQYLQQSTTLQGLYQDIVRAVADLSVRNADPQLSAVLARQGIKVTKGTAPDAAAADSGATSREGDTSREHTKGARHHE